MKQVYVRHHITWTCIIWNNHANDTVLYSFYNILYAVVNCNFLFVVHIFTFPLFFTLPLFHAQRFNHRSAQVNFKYKSRVKPSFNCLVDTSCHLSVFQYCDYAVLSAKMTQKWVTTSEKINISVINHNGYLIFGFMQKANAHITLYCSCAESRWLPCGPNEPMEAPAHHSDMQCFCTHEPENTQQLHLRLLEKPTGCQSLSLPSG